MCDGVSESEWISVEELLDLVGMRPFERGEEDGNDGMCGLGLGDGDVNGCGRGKESRFHNVMVLCVSLNPYINIPLFPTKNRIHFSMNRVIFLVVTNEENEEKTVNDEVEDRGNPNRTKHPLSLEFETIGSEIPDILSEEEEKKEKNPLCECE